MNYHWRMLVGWGCRAERNKREKKWDNCDSVINKIYLKKKVQRAYIKLLSPVSRDSVPRELLFHSRHKRER